MGQERKRLRSQGRFSRRKESVVVSASSIAVFAQQAESGNLWLVTCVSTPRLPSTAATLESPGASCASCEPESIKAGLRKTAAAAQRRALAGDAEIISLYTDGFGWL